MKKLYKNAKTVKNSIRAYACTWKCGCDYTNCNNESYRTNMRDTTVHGDYREH